MILTKILLLIFVILGTPGLLEAADLLQLRQADKVALALTGKPLADDLRTRFLKGDLTLDAIANQLSSGPEFIEYFAGFWARTMGMQSPISAYDLKSIKTGTTVAKAADRKDWFGIDNRSAPTLTVAKLTAYYDAHLTVPVRITIQACADAPLIVWADSANMVTVFKKAAVDGIGPDDKPVLAGTQAIWAKLQALAESGSSSCTDIVQQVKPWWDPIQVTTSAQYIGVSSYKASALILDRCGPALAKCTLSSAPAFDRFMDLVDQDITLEPSYIIAHTVAEDKPFSDIVTTQQTIMTPTYGYFMSTLGKDLWGNFPNGGYPDLDNAVFKETNPLIRTHTWVNRGAQNAGVLTTPAFQLFTNGRRAKANRAYETFLCKKFVVPEGAQADPEDSNPDLTKRAYCSYCHKSIEPMAAFFNRWPTTGETNFIFNQAADVNDLGRFNALEGKGAAAFGTILADSEGFGECSVRRAFEFLNARKMNSTEIENILPNLVNEFQESQRNLRTVIKLIVLSPQFLNPKGG